MFYRAIKHGYSLRSTTTHVLLHDKTQVGIFYFHSNTFFQMKKGDLLRKFTGFQVTFMTS